MKICVFCSSSDYLDEQYYEEARTLGTLLGQLNHQLIFGGTHVGLMGALARAVRENNGRITGVIPRLIHEKGIAFHAADELIQTKDLRERKATMEKISDGFIALPGGFGTLEELFEMVTLKQLQVHLKPVVLINTLGYFDELLSFFDRLFRERFASERYRSLVHVADHSSEALKYLMDYQPEGISDKWSP